MIHISTIGDVQCQFPVTVTDNLAKLQSNKTRPKGNLLKGAIHLTNHIQRIRLPTNHVESFNSGR